MAIATSVPKQAHLKIKESHPPNLAASSVNFLIALQNTELVRGLPTNRIRGMIRLAPRGVAAQTNDRVIHVFQSLFGLRRIQCR
jgi:hypothetical protein